MIAFTWGDSLLEPKEKTGTRSTWDLCRSANKIHIPLSLLLRDKYIIPVDPKLINIMETKEVIMKEETKETKEKIVKQEEAKEEVKKEAKEEKDTKMEPETNIDLIIQTTLPISSKHKRSRSPLSLSFPQFQAEEESKEEITDAQPPMSLSIPLSQPPDILDPMQQPTQPITIDLPPLSPSPSHTHTQIPTSSWSTFTSKRSRVE
jgi:hypothetical protein